MFWDILQFTPRSTQFYLTVDNKKQNKLLNFDCEKNRNKDSKLFLMAIGWDEAPSSGTVFLFVFFLILSSESPAALRITYSLDQMQRKFDLLSLDMYRS